MTAADEQQQDRLAEIEARVRDRYAPFDPGPCRVCGGPLSIGATGPEGATWECPTMEDDPDLPGALRKKPGRDGRDEYERGGHYARSLVHQHRRDDPDVIAVLVEVERLTAALAEERVGADRLAEALKPLILAWCDPKCKRVGHFKACYAARAALAEHEARPEGEGE